MKLTAVFKSLIEGQFIAHHVVEMRCDSRSELRTVFRRTILNNSPFIDITLTFENQKTGKTMRKRPLSTIRAAIDALDEAFDNLFGRSRWALTD